MPTKSYTLADGSTATVTATDNGAPFNEGMQALTKAIKAKINTSSGSGTGASGKQEGVITLSNFRVGNNYNYILADIQYNGDAQLYGLSSSSPNVDNNTPANISGFNAYNINMSSYTWAPITIASGSVTLPSSYSSDRDTTSTTGIIFAEETQNYTSAIATFTLSLWT